MNVLIIGFGAAGKHYYKLLNNFNFIKNIYVCDDVELPKIKKIKKFIFNKKNLKKFDIKHAIVATPSNLHYKYSKVLIENSINLIIEKPFVLKISHAKELISLSKNKNIKCWVSFQNRFNKAIQGLKEIVRKKIIGNIFLVDCSLVWKRDKTYYDTSWRGDYSSDGGVLTNQAIHLLDSLVYIFGDVKKVNSIIEYNKKKLNAEDLVVLNSIHTNNLISNIKATTRADSNYRSAMDILGEKGRVLVKGVSLNTLHMLKNNKIYDIKKSSENFEKGAGAVGAMGTGHKKILKEFFNKKKKKSSKNLEISKNIHVLEIIHTVYNQRKLSGFSKVTNKQSILGR
jgi:predicted dehydrogenase